MVLPSFREIMVSLMTNRYSPLQHNNWFACGNFFRRPAARLMVIMVSVFLLGGAPGTEPNPQDTPEPQHMQERLGPPDPAAQLPTGDDAWEYWDLNATFSSGHHITARFMITNFGPGSQSAVVLGHVTLPNGQIVEWDNGRKKSRWKLSENGRRIGVGSSHLYLEDPVYIFEIDKNFLNIKLQFAPEEGEHLKPDMNLPEGYHTQTLTTGQAVTGQLWIADIVEEEIELEGFITLTHSWSSESEADAMLRRIEILSMEEDSSLEVVDLTIPDGTHFQWLALTEKGIMTYITQDFEIALEGRAPNYRSKKFWVPERMHLTGAGVNGMVTLSQITSSRNPLKVLPQPFRFLASFASKPRLVWAQAPFELDIKIDESAPPVHRQGTGIAVMTFTNPVKPPKK